MILKLGMTHQGMELYKVRINHDPGMTLTYFTARSTEVPLVLWVFFFFFFFWHAYQELST